MYAEQFFLLALTDPSLQIKVLPWQCDMPPFRPLHGELAAASGIIAKHTTMPRAQISTPAAYLISAVPQRPLADRTTLRQSALSNRDKQG
jgi:hypothetical protein